MGIEPIFLGECELNVAYCITAWWTLQWTRSFKWL